MFSRGKATLGIHALPGYSPNHQTPFMQGMEAGKRIVRGETDAVVAGRTSSQPRGLRAKDKGDPTLSWLRGPRPTPAPGFIAQRAPLLCPEL